MIRNYVLLLWRMYVAVCARIYIHAFCTYVCARVMRVCVCDHNEKKIGRSRYASTSLPGSVRGAPD